MAVSSIYNSILEAVVERLQTLTIVEAGKVVKRKLPEAEEQLESLPLLCVVPSDGPLETKNISFGLWSVSYPVQVVYISANNGDQLTGLDRIAANPETARSVFNTPLLSGVPSVWDMDIKDAPVLDRGKINQNYDYCPFFQLVFKSAESRTSS